MLLMFLSALNLSLEMKFSYSPGWQVIKPFNKKQKNKLAKYFEISCLLHLWSEMIQNSRPALFSTLQPLLLIYTLFSGCSKTNPQAEKRQDRWNNNCTPRDTYEAPDPMVLVRNPLNPAAKSVQCAATASSSSSAHCGEGFAAARTEGVMG